MARLFDVIENPLAGWETRTIKMVHHIDEPSTWTVSLMRIEDGTAIEFTHEDLYIAWARAIEAARTLHLQLDYSGDPQSAS